MGTWEQQTIDRALRTFREVFKDYKDIKVTKCDFSEENTHILNLLVIVDTELDQEDFSYIEGWNEDGEWSFDIDNVCDRAATQLYGDIVNSRNFTFLSMERKSYEYKSRIGRTLGHFTRQYWEINTSPHQFKVMIDLWPTSAAFDADGDELQKYFEKHAEPEVTHVSEDDFEIDVNSLPIPLIIQLKI